MNDFLNKISQKGKELAEKAADIADKAVDTAEDLVEKGKDKTQELKIKNEMRDCYAKIGELVYDQKVNGSAIDGVDALVAKVTALKEQLKELQEKAAVRDAQQQAETEQAEEAPQE